MANFNLFIVVMMTLLALVVYLGILLALDTVAPTAVGSIEPLLMGGFGLLAVLVTVLPSFIWSGLTPLRRLLQALKTLKQQGVVSGSHRAWNRAISSGIWYWGYANYRWQMVSWESVVFSLVGVSSNAFLASFINCSPSGPTTHRHGKGANNP
jgi:hypothetical protein